jgi:hypothetical protein
MSQTVPLSMSDRTAATIPRLAMALGLGGLVPFWALALARVTGVPHAMPPTGVETALAVYAATILSFLGGIRWGTALRERDQHRVAGDYIFGVMPQLLGWAALALPDPWRPLLLGLLVLALGPIDRNLVARGMAPVWFGRLRLMLSLGAGAALFLAALA